MLPLHVQQKNYPRILLESDFMARAHRFFTRHFKNRTSVTGGILLTFICLYFLWPVSVRSSLQLFSPGNKNQPSYTNWPKAKRAHAVKEAFVHAYGSYEKYAMPADELMPVRNKTQQNFNGWGVSVYDALDTLWLMDMKPEFERAVDHVSQTPFHTHPKYQVMFFETVIRYFGGLLSAYALSGRQVLLHKADELAQRLLPVFRTPSGMPAFSIDVDTGEINIGPRQGDVVLAEIASCQMEYKYLAHVTDMLNYFTISDKTMDWMERSQLQNGMWSTMWNISSGEQTDNHITIGALADSGYEYLLKQYLLSGKSETRLRDMYLKSASGIIRNLLYLSPNRQILYVTDIYTTSTTRPAVPTRKFEHLSCFLPGLLALGAHTLADEMDPEERDLHNWAAAGLAHSCWLMYAEQPTGLAPEEVVFQRSPNVNPGGMGRILSKTGDGEEELSNDDLWIDAVQRWKNKGKRGMPPGVPNKSGNGAAKPLLGANADRREYFALNPKYLLRPETIESLYVLWRTTGNELWRERGWQIFLAIEENCRMPVGYASVYGVDTRAFDRSSNKVILHLDEMPSYALAETWKYLYLMFLDYDPLPMDKFVFNTEAHPFPIFEWSLKEKAAIGLS